MHHQNSTAYKGLEDVLAIALVRVSVRLGVYVKSTAHLGTNGEAAVTCFTSGFIFQGYQVLQLFFVSRVDVGRSKGVLIQFAISNPCDFVQY